MSESDSLDPAAAEELLEILSDMSEILRQADDRGATRLDKLRQEARDEGVSSILDELSSGEMWGHMGSFFDNSLSDRTLNRRYMELQLQLADVLARLGAETSHVSHWADALRTWQRRGRL